MSGDAELYDDTHVVFLEKLWGEGYLSPGGAREVARVLEGLDLTGLTVIDIGCGAGGITAALARDHGAAHVIGLDVEETVCAVARRRAEAEGVADRVEIRRVDPGPMPIRDGSVDLVFSKDSIVHIEDKHALARDIFRVLGPGGWFAASDWLISHDDEPSPEMAAYIAAEDLNFAMASPERYRDALEQAGFEAIRLVDRNAWYLAEATAELARMEGPERPDFEATLPEGELDAQLDTWRKMIRVLDSGEHRPHHLRARKPGAA